VSSAPVDETLLAAARVYSERSEWVESSDKAVEYLTIINGNNEVLFTNHLQPGVASAVGFNCMEFIPPDQQHKLSGAIAKTRETGLPWHFETQATGPDGEMSYYSGWATALGDREGDTRIALVGTDVSHVRRVEEELAVSDETFRSMVTGAFDYICLIDRDHRISFINRVKYRADTNDVLGTVVENFLAENDRAMVRAAIERVFETGSFESYETIVKAEAEGQEIRLVLQTRLSPIYSGGQVQSVTMVSTDVTENVRNREALAESENKLRQSQQLQAIGQLTGGIAHDFNNLLMVMQGSLSLARRNLEDPAALTQLLDDAIVATERAATLTQRLLAFGRRQSLQPVSIEVPSLLDSMSVLMRRTLGAHVRIETETDDDIENCFADLAQLESALLNLAINARDALGPSGGSMYLRGSKRIVDTSNSEQWPDLDLGTYVCLTVRDDGPGIESDVISRAFEPFFTTKEASRGSGLGLSMVYGFAQQSGGHVAIESVIGTGTSVHLYLPCFSGQQSNSEVEEEPSMPVRQGDYAHILVVEDVPEVAQLTTRILGLYGYSVSVVDCGEKALEMLEEDSEIQVLLTDIGLSGSLNGVALSREVLSRRPNIRVLFMTGYDHGLLDDEPGARVLAKPFTPSQLAAAVEELLATPKT